MNEEILLSMTQFGAAGLIGLLWIIERRHNLARERQLDQAHRKLVDTTDDRQALVQVVKENTAAVSGLQKSQEQLLRLLETNVLKSPPSPNANVSA